MLARQGLTSRFIPKNPLDLCKEAGLFFGGQESEKLQSVGMAAVAPMRRHDSSGRLLFKRFSFFLSENPKGEQFPEIKPLLRMKEKTGEADVADCDFDRPRPENDASPSRRRRCGAAFVDPEKGRPALPFR
ncbi:MAG: hypothetical protein MPW14_16705 [Candidatus Manganitrophus sp.]|nr:MAG: hypothetical protein MPW14_16705 [Candidatus Manganitrophus sp.]